MPKLKGSSTVRRASGRAPRPVSLPLYPPESKEVAPKSATLPLTYEQSRLSAQQRGAVVIGVDEAGRGPLAGPVVAAACAVLDPSGNPPVLGVDDSKKVDEEERERLYEELVRHPGLVFGVATVDHAVIDEINILQATFRGMQDATANLVAKLPSSAAIAHVAVDGPHVPPGLRSSYGPVAAGVIGGDARVYSIAAASIVAKVTRDRLMREHDRAYPAYGFAKHKGYGVAGGWRLSRDTCLLRSRRIIPSLFALVLSLQRMWRPSGSTAPAPSTDALLRRSKTGSPSALAQLLLPPPLLMFLPLQGLLLRERRGRRRATGVQQPQAGRG